MLSRYCRQSHRADGLREKDWGRSGAHGSGSYDYNRLVLSTIFSLSSSVVTNNTCVCNSFGLRISKIIYAVLVMGLTTVGAMMAKVCHDVETESYDRKRSCSRE